MGIPRFFKIPQHNSFDYQPLYWDPKKEAREERINRIKAELGQEVELGRKSTMITRGSFRQNYGNLRRKGKESNIRLIIIISVLLLISYLLFYR